jgi:uncharacterized membrane protein YdjX (TVP38/TMEM64 family)
MKPVQRRQTIAIAICIVIALAMSAAWRWTPLGDQIEPAHIAEWIRSVRHSPFGPLALALLYLAGVLLMVPNTALNAATILSLGSAVGMASALAGSMLSALTFYALGRCFGTRILRKLAPHQLERLQKTMKHGGTLKMASLRMVPVAPFTVVNVVAGSARVRALPYSVGTFIGLLPGNLMLGMFGHQLRAVLRSPAPRDIALLAAILVVATAAAWWLRRRTMDA